MTTSLVEDISSIVETTVAPNADEVDAAGAFPRDAIKALGEAGLLGLISSTEVGGRGAGLRSAAEVVEHLARACGSTAMVVCMHYCATAVLEAHGPRETREAIARGGHLTTLAFSETGSRSHFWAPLSTATADGDDRVVLDASKSWVTSAGEADSYVWSSTPLAAEGPSTLWLVPADRPGLDARGRFDGFGLRGNASRPVTAQGVVVGRDAMLGTDGRGDEIMLGVVLAHFHVLNAATSLGLMESAIGKAIAHVTTARLEHLGRRLADSPVTRANIARMRLIADQARTVLGDALAAIEGDRPDATLRVLEVKAAASEAAIAVTDLAMRVCGGAAFRKEGGLERYFRDARAATVMAPTTEAIHDFMGRALCGMPLFD
ncbi:acyl-CoA dehydrogenase family protein [Saccharothrix syringae]|uniref:Acyl-CoA dehydrogenase n=1 Tax=Saccharothrix syringae TaxID=103733 RepID=A0A5Q0GXT3_SACSY|nr:acyl-CoA dehydrogenase family protein [Saccharothrix syringae]QFZ18324.1 acyl-CoA dehydrogenase [Saccharothrix syringae]